MEALSILICKEGFTVPKVKNGMPLNLNGPDKNVAWGAVVDNKYDVNKNNIIQLMIVMLSQSLFYFPDSYHL